jgi:hypothetical protein
LGTEDRLTACLDRVLATLREANPGMGQTVAIDGSDMPAYANGHKHVGNKNGPLRTRWADPDGGRGTGPEPWRHLLRRPRTPVDRWRHAGHHGRYRRPWHYDGDHHRARPDDYVQWPANEPE